MDGISLKVNGKDVRVPYDDTDIEIIIEGKRILTTGEGFIQILKAQLSTLTNHSKEIIFSQA